MKFKILALVMMSGTVMTLTTLIAGTAAAKSLLPKAADFVELSGSEKDTEKDSVKETGKENEATLTGTVRVMRKIEHTEVFFKDLPDSYVIPSGNKYSSIYNAMTESQKNGTAVTFRANTKSRRVLSMEAAGEKNRDKTGDTPGSEAVPSAAAKSTK